MLSWHKRLQGRDTSLMSFHFFVAACVLFVHKSRSPFLCLEELDTNNNLIYRLESKHFLLHHTSVTYPQRHPVHFILMVRRNKRYNKGNHPIVFVLVDLISSSLLVLTVCVFAALYALHRHPFRRRMKKNCLRCLMHKLTCCCPAALPPLRSAAQPI